MMTLGQAQDHIGEGVVCRAPAHHAEEGTIRAVGTLYVFVQYKGDMHSKATRPEDIELLAGAKE